jgi:uncharacterized protein
MIGLGYRRDFADEFINGSTIKPDFVEFAPENWMNIGGYWKKQLDQLAEKYPIVCHGLSLSIGSPDRLDYDYLKALKKFLDIYHVSLYSEHLSFSKCDNAHLYDLLPIPFREDAAYHVADRIKEVQDILERTFVMENVSYYTPVAAEMDEATFISTIVERSGCQLLLDVNNVYVNAFNHNYDAKSFISRLPLDKVGYIHIAGHEQIAPDLIIDTHGQAIIDPVYDLFEWTIAKLKNEVPVLLERDFNIPEMQELQGEMNRLHAICNLNWKKQHELIT